MRWGESGGQSATPKLLEPPRQTALGCHTANA